MVKITKFVTPYDRIRQIENQIIETKLENGKPMSEERLQEHFFYKYLLDSFPRDRFSVGDLKEILGFIHDLAAHIDVPMSDIKASLSRAQLRKQAVERLKQELETAKGITFSVAANLAVPRAIEQIEDYYNHTLEHHNNILKLDTATMTDLPSDKTPF